MNARDSHPHSNSTPEVNSRTEKYVNAPSREHSQNPSQYRARQSDNR